MMYRQIQRIITHIVETSFFVAYQEGNIDEKRVKIHIFSLIIVCILQAMYSNPSKTPSNTKACEILTCKLLSAKACLPVCNGPESVPYNASCKETSLKFNVVIYCPFLA